MDTNPILKLRKPPKLRRIFRKKRNQSNRLSKMQLRKSMKPRMKLLISANSLLMNIGKRLRLMKKLNYLRMNPKKQNRRQNQLKILPKRLKKILSMPFSK